MPLPFLPAALSLAFGLTTGLAIFLFSRAMPRPGRVLTVVLLWTLGQGAVLLSGFYTDTHALPPRLALLLGPPLLTILLLFGTARGRRFLDGLQMAPLTLLHVVRLPVELVLLGLYRYQAVPRLMTFEGRNWDILLGLTAPVVWWLVFRRPRLERTALRLWNGLGLLSLLNIVGNALLSVPTPLQRFAFDQPNVAILYFPFGWLPGVVVPLVLLAHLAALWQLGPRVSRPAKALHSAPGPDGP